MRDALERAWAHVAWANGKLGERLVEVEGREDVEEALRLFTHLVWSERVWLDRIREGSSSQLLWPPGGTGLEVAPVLGMAVRNAEEVQGILLRSDEDALHRPVGYRNTSGTAYETSLGDILLHVALHGSYHRGQVARSLREAGVEPVNTDYVTFVRQTGDREG